MNKRFNIITTILAVAIATILLGCASDTPVPTPEIKATVQTKLLAEHASTAIPTLEQSSQPRSAPTKPSQHSSGWKPDWAIAPPVKSNQVPQSIPGQSRTNTDLRTPSPRLSQSIVEPTQAPTPIRKQTPLPTIQPIPTPVPIRYSSISMACSSIASDVAAFALKHGYEDYSYHISGGKSVLNKGMRC